MQQMDVSVLIPTFNRPDLLQQTLDSVLAQTRPAREIIVVGNGTDDDTRRMLERYGSRVVYIKMDPVGVQAARNRGIAEASPTWIAILDDDDLYHPTFLESIGPVIEDGRAEMIVTDHRKFVHPIERGEFIEKANGEMAPEGYWEGVPRPNGDAEWSYVGSFPPERLLRLNAFYPSTMVLRKDFVERLGGFDPGVRGIPAEDMEFTSRAIPAGQLAIVWKDLVSYRMHQSNTSGDPIKQRIGRWRIFERVREKNAHGSPALAAALEENLPVRRRVIFDLAFRHGRFDVLVEVAPRLSPPDRTLKRKAKLRVAKFPRPLQETALFVARQLSPAMKRDRQDLRRWSPGARD